MPLVSICAALSVRLSIITTRSPKSFISPPPPPSPASPSDGPCHTPDGGAARGGWGLCQPPRPGGQGTAARAASLGTSWTVVVPLGPPTCLPQPLRLPHFAHKVETDDWRSPPPPPPRAASCQPVPLPPVVKPHKSGPGHDLYAIPVSHRIGRCPLGASVAEVASERLTDSHWHDLPQQQPPKSIPPRPTMRHSLAPRSGFPPTTGPPGSGSVGGGAPPPAPSMLH